MAGGTFNKAVGKERPGTYINFIDNNTDLVTGSERGTVLLPLANTDYGPAGKFISITASGLDAAKNYLGYSVYDNDPNYNMLLIREAFKGASKVIVYICTEGTTAATGSGGGLSATAKYKGERGNRLSYVVLDNPLGGYDVEVYFDGTKIEEYEAVSNATDLSGSEYIDFSGLESEELTAIAGVTLSGGANGTTKNDDVVAFLDAAEGISFDTMVFPFTDSTLHTALKTKIKYMRDNMGKYVQAVAPNFAADYEGIINVTNSYALDNLELTTAQATAYVAGITAGASAVQSNTYKTVDSAIGVVGVKANEEAEQAIKAGEFFFSVSEEGKVIVEYDINSFVSFVETKGEQYRKNKVIRVLDSFARDIQLDFPPNKYDNDPDGWEIMEGVGRKRLKLYGPRSSGGTGAIKNIEYDNDFKVDTELSERDKTYFKVGLEPVDSAEKLFFEINTR